ncbi:MAG TPA: nitrilase-related carbon-nitrogen hydrolase [bacterium]
MKIGFVQFSPILGDLDANLSEIERLLAGAPPADLLVLPELCSTGYSFTSAAQARELSEEIRHGRLVRLLERICANKNLYVVAGVDERDDDHIFNTSVLVGPQGYIGKYRKLHLFMNEKDIFTPGDSEPPIFNVGICKLGMLICFDWIFPEIWRVLALKGADLICHPSNLVLPGFCQRAIPVHALINRFYIITANRIGTEGDLTFTGLSMIADPNGHVLAQASSDREEIGIAEMDIALARDKMMTPRNHVLDDRRPEFYWRLLPSK